MATNGSKIDHLGWDDLRTALSVAREGSVRSAARALGVSHSTVLRRLHVLEAAAGVRLFQRTAEGYEVTPAGQDVFDTATEVEERVLGLERRVTGRDLRLSGGVRVTLPDPLWPAMAPVFRELSSAYPDIDVTLSVSTEYADLAHRAADVAVRIAAQPPADLVGRRVGSAGVGIYGSASYLQGRSTRELAALDWVGWDAGSEMAFARWTASHIPSERVTVRVSAGWQLRDAVDADLGVAILPSALGEHQRHWRRVKLLPELAPPLWILTHRDLRTTARVRVVRDFLAEAILNRRTVFEGK